MCKRFTMMLSYITILLLFLWSVESRYINLNYSEVAKFGNSCPQLDSCEFQDSTGGREWFSIKERNCACDSLCPEYGDCCIDASGDEISGTVSNLKCLNIEDFGGVYMTDSCHPSYEGSDDIRTLCEETIIGDQKDPIGSMPVTDSLTGQTYKNYYCSMCNDKSDNAVLWSPKLECPLLSFFNTSNTLTNDYILENLDTDGHKWGLYLGENESSFFHECEIVPVAPLILKSKIRLCKPNLISDCPSTWEDNDVRAMCRSYMGPKFLDEDRGYKNTHCALCNSIDITRLSCHSGEFDDLDIFRLFGSYSFALLLDMNQKTGQKVGMVQMCENDEIFDPFFKKCRSLICLPGFLRQGKQCIPPRISISSTETPTTDEPIISIHSNFSESERNITYDHERLLTVSQDSIPDLKNLSGKSHNISEDTVEKFQNCSLISLVKDDFVMLQNKTVFVPKYNKLYSPSSYYALDGSVLVCSHFISENEIKFLPSMGYVTLLCLGVSMFFLILHFFAVCVVRDLQNLSGMNLMSQCIALFCAYFCFIIGQIESMNLTYCTVIAFLTFYFFQVSFLWMGIMSYDVCRILKKSTTQLRTSSGKHLFRFFIYSLVAWVTPLLMLIILWFAEYTNAFPADYRPEFANPHCWFKGRHALLAFFATPLFIIMLLNVIFYVSSVRMICMTTQTRISRQSTSQRRDFRLYLRLALLMGLTWIIGIFASCVDIPFLWYVFILSNTLQGLFIFITFSYSKLLNYLRKKLTLTSTQRVPVSSSNIASSGSGCKTKSTTVSV